MQTNYYGSNIYQFQSTCPARGTTPPCGLTLHISRHFNPRAPRGARPLKNFLVRHRVRFQSTCPARGTTSEQGRFFQRYLLFQSTCPARGTTLILFLRMELISYFNPRAPRGARPVNRTVTLPAWIFQSTCPARGTTLSSKSFDQVSRISIHVPREGHDADRFALLPAQHEFQSTCPARGTTVPCQQTGGRADISIHVPREGHDRVGFLAYAPACHFNPRAPRGARHSCCDRVRRR